MDLNTLQKANQFTLPFKLKQDYARNQSTTN